MGSGFVGFRPQRPGIQTSVQRSLSLGVPHVEFVTVKITAVSLAISRDVLVQFTRPYNFFFVASLFVNFKGSSLFVHFWPLHQPGTLPSNAINPSGGESWLPINDNTEVALVNEDDMEARYFRTRFPIQQFYVDIDHPNGAGSPFMVTFGGSNDIHSMLAERL